MSGTLTRAVAGVALTVALVACGVASSEDVLVERRMATPDAKSTASTASTAAPSTAPSTTAGRPDERLSIDDALMDEGDIAPPWEFRYRSAEQPGYGAGPNQTDCEPYWRYEQRHDLPGAQALWWRDGGNVNHEVFRAASADAATDFLATMRMLPELCPVTSWSEGDSFRTEAVDLGDADVVGLEFIDASPEERQHTAISVRGDLISVVWVGQWPASAGGEFPHTSTADLAGWAARADERLAGAGQAPPLVASTSTSTTPTTTTITTAPAGQAPPTTVAETPTTTIPGTRPTTTVQTSPDPTGIARYLVTDADLADLPAWTVGPPAEFYEGNTDSSLFEGCAARGSIDELGRSFVLESTLDHESYLRSWQYIGETADGEAAAGLVAEFATIADCELASAPFPATVGGGPLDVPGTSAAAVLEFSTGDPGTPEWAELRLVVLAAGPRVTALAFSSSNVGSPEPAEMDRIIEIAAFKLAG